MSERGENDTHAAPNQRPGKLGILRIIDAEANRAAEGLRVVEDYVRFVLSDQHLTRLAKDLRHELVATLQCLSIFDRLAARQADADVGAMLAPPAESARTQPGDVATASFKRVQQALRCLEEYTKLDNPSTATKLERLRFEIYTLERAAGIASDSIDRLADVRLYVLLDGRASEAEFATLAESLVTAGVPLIQLRDKRLADRELLARA